MSPRSVVITGCNRGIGLELIKQYLKSANPPTHLFATCRDPSKATELVDLSKANSSLHILALDVTDHSAYPKIVEEVSNIVGADEGLNLLINNAGVLPSERTNPGGVTPQMMRDAFEVNTVAPLFLTKAFLPLLTTAANKNANNPIGISRAAAIMMSTAVASIAENSGGGVTAYRCSKTALNMAMKNLSIELKDTGIITMAMHPGWVKTDMGGPNGMLDTEECASTMLKTLESLDESKMASFLRYNGTSIQW